MSIDEIIVEVTSVQSISSKPEIRWLVKYR